MIFNHKLFVIQRFVIKRSEGPMQSSPRNRTKMANTQKQPDREGHGLNRAIEAAKKICGFSR
jgi:hypothetical protein